MTYSVCEENESSFLPFSFESRIFLFFNFCLARAAQRLFQGRWTHGAQPAPVPSQKGGQGRHGQSPVVGSPWAKPCGWVAMGKAPWLASSSCSAESRGCHCAHGASPPPAASLGRAARDVWLCPTFVPPGRMMDLGREEIASG